MKKVKITVSKNILSFSYVKENEEIKNFINSNKIYKSHKSL